MSNDMIAIYFFLGLLTGFIIAACVYLLYQLDCSIVRSRWSLVRGLGVLAHETGYGGFFFPREITQLKSERYFGTVGEYLLNAPRDKDIVLGIGVGFPTGEPIARFFSKSKTWGFLCYETNLTKREKIYEQ